MDPVGTPVPPGSRLGRFKLRSFLGRGTYGDVFEAVDSQSGTPVSLKVLSTSASDEARAGLQREARALELLQHPAIPALLASGELEDRLFLALRFVPGRSLRDRLREGRLSPHQSLAIVRDLAGALGHCHAREVVHADLKPENVVLDDAGRPHLLDFGMAAGRALPPRQRPGGTPRYMAPEQLQGLDPVPSTDLYQLGLVLFECLVGRPAFHTRKRPARALEDRTTPPALPDSLPASFQDLLEELVAPGLRHELPDAGAVIERVEELLSGLPPDPGQEGETLPAPASATIPRVAVRAPTPVRATPPGSSPAAPSLFTGELLAIWAAAFTLPALAFLWGPSLLRLLGARLPPALLVGGLLGLLVEWLQPALRLRRRTRARLAAGFWGLLLATALPYGWFLGGSQGESILWRIWGFFPILSLLILLTVPFLFVGLRFLVQLDPRRLLEKELGPPALVEMLAPGTGHLLHGEDAAQRLVAGGAALSLLTLQLGVGWLGGLAVLAASLLTLFQRGDHRITVRQAQEAELLIDLQETSEEKARCQAGMGILTAALVRAVRHRQWELPELVRGTAILKGTVPSAAAGGIPEALPCFKAGRFRLLRAQGRVHLFCERHDLCPSPLPEQLDRGAATDLQGTSTEASTASGSDVSAPTALLPDAPEGSTTE